MKNKTKKISILLFIFILSICTFSSFEKPTKCKILNVIEADEFIIDFNKNNKIDKNETVKLKDAISFKATSDEYSNMYAKKLNISEKELLKIGYIAKLWAEEQLLNREAYIQRSPCLKNEICKVDIIINKQKYSNLLLKNGLGFISETQNNKKHNLHLKIKQIYNNISETPNQIFLLKNINTNVIHKLNCEHIKESKKIKILSKNEAILSNNVYCKKCSDIILEKTYQKLNIPKSKKIYKTSFFKNFKNIDLYFINPLEHKKPSKSPKTEFAKRLIDEINNSKETIDIALYEFGDQEEIYNALLHAKNRNIKIRVVSDSSNDENYKHEMHFKFIKEFNATLDKSTSFMHNKFFIFDNRLVMTGSANISVTGSGGYNANLVAFIKDKKIIQRYKQEFEQMYNSNFSTKKKNLPNFESDINVYFSPKDNIYHDVISDLIKNSTDSIYISAFYLTDKDIIKDLIQARKRGVEILIILDATGAMNFKERVDKLRKNNILVAIENWGGKNHEKTIVIDEKILILGSCNFSKNGFYKNDENIIVINNENLSLLYKDYFLYLFNLIDKKFLFSIPRAEGLESINSCYDGIDNNFDGSIDASDKGCMLNN
ncbi:MAG: DUF1669 domain-containing protein [Candidatus Gastranaerophilales bacterium]|nr:DUF1669 domain-containing protein [Candidatus Gastranaerophilales bacterium]